ncbi:MAG TPA: signal peptide peptidase SppA, partial [Victivallales bacterium]|nr:signal peptide peptidase SppA [Victivallales bacterium]
MNNNRLFSLILLIVISGLCGCMSIKLNFISDKTDPLKEFILSGDDTSQKILLLNIEGIISSTNGFNLLGESPSMVEEIRAHLEKASHDDKIKALLIKVDSPGGATTASDLIYHEIETFKIQRKTKIFVMMMDIATSGAYMISLPADKIFAQPTKVTGSIGVIFMRPKINGLMEKIGVDVKVSKSGENKDMGSPFRSDSDSEEMIFENMVKNLNNHFYDLVLKHRKIDEEKLKIIKSARVFMATEAKELGLIDEIAYPSDIILKSKIEANLKENAALVVYRRKNYPNDNIYNKSSMRTHSAIDMLNITPLNTLSGIKTGFYY